MATLAEIRARLSEQEPKAGTRTMTSDNAIFPFWNIPENSTAILRFLPDGDASNDFPWRERQIINLDFPGVKGGDENKRITVKVPCVEMWKETCPVHAEIRPWYKDPSLKEEANKYWKKRSYIFQGFAVQSSLAEETVPENPIRRFIINTSIFNIIKAGLMDPEMESLFTDYDNGTDFRLTKTTKGQYADYTTSNFARRERGLSEVERAAIEQYGLFSLNDFMPKKPSKEEVDVIYDMFKASVDGELYDPQRWGQFFKPSGFMTDNDTSSRETVSKPVSKPTVVQSNDEEPPFDPDPAPSPESKKNVNDILSMIRNRQQNK